MSLRAIELSPSADIHLANVAAFRSVTLQAWLYDEGHPARLVTAARDPRFPDQLGLRFEIDAPDVALTGNLLGNDQIQIDVTTGELAALPPAGDFEQFEIYLFVLYDYRVQVQGGFSFTTFRVPVRVTVHESFPEIWLGNNRGTVNAGSDNFVASVYAENPAHEVVDITGHGFVSLILTDAPGGNTARAEAPNRDTVDGPHAATDDELSVNRPDLYRAGDVLRVSRTEEMLRVTETTSASPIAVERSIGSVAAEALVDGDAIWNLGGIDAISGRVRAPLGAEDVRLSIVAKEGSRLRGSIQVTVGRALLEQPGESAAAAESRRLVEELASSGPDPRRNILFVAEGFNLDQEPDFKKFVRRVARRLRKRRVHEPFRMLRHDYRLWAAFPRSFETGITVNTRVNPSGELSDSFEPDKDRRLLQARDSPFGLCYGRRAGEIPFEPAPGALFNLDPAFEASFEAADLTADLRQAFLDGGAELPEGAAISEFSEGLRWTVSRPPDRPPLVVKKEMETLFVYDAEDTARQHWHNFDRQHDQLLKDWRRLGSDRAQWHAEALDWLAGLGPKDAGVAATIGESWGRGGGDQGRVLFVVNDEVSAGTYTHGDSAALDRFLFGAVTLLNGTSFALLENAPKTDHAPDPPPALDAIVRVTRQLVAIHELAHAIFLGDEYEKQAGDPLSTREFDNLDTDSWIDESNHTKWAGLPRVAKGSALAADARVAVAGEIEITLAPGQGALWSQSTTPQVSWLSRNVNPASEAVLEPDPETARPMFETYPSYRAHPYRRRDGLDIRSVSGDRIVLESASLEVDDVLPAGSMIYEPLPGDAGPMSLVLPAVLGYMNGREFPLHDKIPPNGCNNADPAVTVVPSWGALANPPVIEPKKRQRLIGLYEGGGQQICEVYRPTGECMMRNEYELVDRIAVGGQRARKVRFCHVCRYIILHEFNPSLHARLDELYPGSPLP